MRIFEDILKPTVMFVNSDQVICKELNQIAWKETLSKIAKMAKGFSKYPNYSLVEYYEFFRVGVRDLGTSEESIIVLGSLKRTTEKITK